MEVRALQTNLPKHFEEQKVRKPKTKELKNDIKGKKNYKANKCEGVGDAVSEIKTIQKDLLSL